MNSHGSGFCSKTVNTVLNFFSIGRAREHHICHFINNKDNTIHFFLSFRTHLFVVFIQISYSLVFERRVSLFHLLNRSLKEFDRFPTIIHNRSEQIR